MVKVKLTYFKPSGKYYSEGTFEMRDGVEINQVWDMVDKLQESGCLPELMEGCGKNFIIQVDCPDAKHSHSRLIVPSHILCQCVKK